jgi:hypothetical protein
MESNNVIVFPKKQFKTQMPNSLEEISNNMDMIRHVHIGETLAVVAPMLFEQLSIAGFDFSEDGDDLKHGAFIVEGIRSMLMHGYSMEHPFQELAEAVFIEDGEDSLRIVERVNLEFKSHFVHEDLIEDELE